MKSPKRCWWWHKNFFQLSSQIYKLTKWCVLLVFVSLLARAFSLSLGVCVCALQNATLECAATKSSHPFCVYCIYALIHFVKWFTLLRRAFLFLSFFCSLFIRNQVFAYIWLVTLITQIICWLSLCKDFIHKIFYEHFFGLLRRKCDWIRWCEWDFVCFFYVICGAASFIQENLDPFNTLHNFRRLTIYPFRMSSIKQWKTNAYFPCCAMPRKNIIIS